ncbi:hypothetical protein LOD99_5447 [Oopsacas minuta]|uniref:Uncharacterized protein n=1 Tax=Oopsacas minuta TaxID=111878 RepID=A0AAV7JQI8_9METZ|nr:hypothetical protein LOD99_5447 [Oopsacas minuta]
MSDMMKDQEETTVKNKEVLDSDMELEEITVATTKHLKTKVGSHVVVQYESELFPGIVEVLDVKGAVVNVMIKYGKYWKWPEKKDEIFYPWSEIKMTIQDPDLVNSRGMYKVPELDHRWT